MDELQDAMLSLGKSICDYKCPLGAVFLKNNRIRLKIGKTGDARELLFFFGCPRKTADLVFGLWNFVTFFFKNPYKLDL